MYNRSAATVSTFTSLLFVWGLKIEIDYNINKNKKYRDNDVVGKVKIKLNDKVVRVEDVYVKVKEVKHKSWWVKLKEWLRW